VRSAPVPAVLIVLVCAALSTQPARGQNPPPQGTATGKLTLSTNSPAAREEFWQGMEDWQTSGYTSGERHFRRAYALDSGFALAHLFSLGEFQAREQAAERDRAVADAARQSMEEGLLALFWREKALGHPARSRELLRAAMQLMPNEPSIAVEYLWASLGANELKPGLDSARAFRARFPNYTPLAYPIPNLLLAAGDTAAAVRAAEEYTRVAPQSPTAFTNYGFFLQLTRRYDEAEAQFRKGMALPTHPDYGADPASALAELYVLRGRPADARAVATEALARATYASDSAMYMTEIAGTYFAAGDDRKGTQLLEQARQKSPIIGSAQNPQHVDDLLSEASAMSGDLRSAHAYVARRHLETANDSAIVLAIHATNSAYAGQLDSAVKYSDQLASIHTVPWSGAVSHRARGLALAAAKQCARAKTELAQAPDTASIEVLTARADCEFQLGNRAAALALRDRAMASLDFTLFDPPTVRARMRLAQMK